MASFVTYHLGGYQAGAATQNKATESDSVAGTFTTWNVAGAQTSQRSLTGLEVAAFAAQDLQRSAVLNRTAIEAKAAAALITNATFLANGSPTAAQVAAQVKLLTRETNGLIRLLLGALTDVSDT